PLRRMVSFALDGIASFSILPLRTATYLGVVVGVSSVLYAIAAVVTHISGFTVPGWTTTVVLVSFLFSVQLLMTGVLAEYVGRIYEQVKRRPLYVVAERIIFGKARRRRDSTRDYGEFAESLPPISAAEPAVASPEKSSARPPPIAPPKPVVPSKPPPLPAGAK